VASGPAVLGLFSMTAACRCADRCSVRGYLVPHADDPRSRHRCHRVWRGRGLSVL